MRLFIAVEIPDEIRHKIGKLISDLKKTEAGVKWVEEKNIHITVKFLGEVKDNDLERLKSLIKDALTDKKIFEASFEGLGTFPGGKTPRVIWIGTEKGKEELKKIAVSLEEILSKNGFRKEEREFTAHATIGRVKEKKNIGELKKAIEEKKSMKFGECVVGHITIIRSRLSPKGPIYEPVEKIELL